MGSIFAKEEKELDLSPGTLNSTSVEDKVWLSVTEENLFNNESFTNEKYFMLQNVIVREGPQEAMTRVRSPRPSSPIGFYTPESGHVQDWMMNHSSHGTVVTDDGNYARSLSPEDAHLDGESLLSTPMLELAQDPSLRPSKEHQRSNDVALSLLTNTVIAEESIQVSLMLTRILDVLPSLGSSSSRYFDSTLQKRLSILRRIHLALHRERARDRLLATGDSQNDATSNLSTSSMATSASNRSATQNAFPIVVRMSVRLLLSVIQKLQEDEETGASVLASLLDLLTELPPLALQHEPLDCLDAFKSWLARTISKQAGNPSSTTGLALEALIALAVAKGSLGDILSSICISLGLQHPTTSNKPSLTLQSLSTRTFGPLNVAPVLAKVHDWHIDLLLSPLSRNSLLGTWNTKLPQLQHVALNPNASPSFPNSIATDGSYLFIHGAHGLCKVGTGFGGTSQGRIYGAKPDFCPTERGWIACVGEKLFFRSPTTSPATMLIVSGSTLEIIAEIFQDGRGSIETFDNTRLPFGPEMSSISKPPPPPRSYMEFPQDFHQSQDFAHQWRSPMFTDGRFLYVLSIVGFFDYRFSKFAVDSYDPHNRMAHVKRVILHYKEGDVNGQLAPVLSPSSLESAGFYTNGQYLVVVTPPSVSNGSPAMNSSYGHSTSDSLAYVCRTFRLDNGELESSLPSDIGESFPAAGPSSFESSMSVNGKAQISQQQFAYGMPISCSYDFANNVVWCSQSTQIARFSNAGIAPKFNTQFGTPSSTSTFRGMFQSPSAGGLPPLAVARDLLSILARLSEESMPNTSASFHSVLSHQPKTGSSSLHSSRASFSNASLQRMPSLPLLGQATVPSPLLLEPFCVEVAKDTFSMLYTLMKESQDKLHAILIDNFSKILDLQRGSPSIAAPVPITTSKLPIDSSDPTLSDPSLSNLDSIHAFIRTHLEITLSCMSILAVNIQRLVAHKLNPADVGLVYHASELSAPSVFEAASSARGSAKSDPILDELTWLQNLEATPCLLTNLRRVLRYFVVAEDLYAFPTDSLTSLSDDRSMAQGSSSSEFGSPLSNLLSSIQLKACQVLTFGLEVFYPSFSEQSRLLLGLLQGADTAIERGHRRLLDSLISALAVHKNPSYLIFPPTSEELMPFATTQSTQRPQASFSGALSPHGASEPGADADMLQQIEPLLSKLLREAQSSLAKSSSANMLSLVQSIQKDLFLRAEDIETRSPNSSIISALIEFVRLVMAHSLDLFSGVMHSSDRATSSSSSYSGPSPQPSWWSHEMMQDVSNSVVGSLIPTLLHSLFLFSSNTLVARSLLPSIVNVLGVLDKIHTAFNQHPQGMAPFPAIAATAADFPRSTPSSADNPKMTKVVESPHPYEAGRVMKQVVTIPDAVFLSLIFDERCSTSDANDVLELYEDEACKRRITTQPSVLSGNRSKWPRRRVLVPGNKVVFLFKPQPQKTAPPKIPSQKFATTFESAPPPSSTTPPPPGSSASPPATVGSKKSATTSSPWGYRCVVIGNMMSAVQSAQPWSIHLEKTLCCLGGQLASSLIRGDPLSDVELELETVWLNHPLFDGGLMPAPSPTSPRANSDSSSAPSLSPEEENMAFLMSILHMHDYGAVFASWLSSLAPSPTPPQLEARLAPVKLAERSVIAAILHHTGLVPLAIQVAFFLDRLRNSSSDDAPPVPFFMDPKGPAVHALRMCAAHMRKIREAIIQLKQQQALEDAEQQSTSTYSPNPDALSYRVFADRVVQRATFLLRDVASSFLRSPVTSDENAQIIFSVNRLGPRLEVLSNVTNAITSFVLDPNPVHSFMHQALIIRQRRAASRFSGFDAMRDLLSSVRGPDMLHEVLHFLGPSVRLSGYRSGVVDERSSPTWPHSFLDHLRGCGPALAARVNGSFEQLWGLLADLLLDPSSSSPLVLISLEPWALKFTKNDWPFLHRIQIFNVLHRVVVNSQIAIENLKASLKHPSSKKTRAESPSASMMQATRSAVSEQHLKTNAEIELKQQVITSAMSIFKLLALTCISPQALEVQSAPQTNKTTGQVPGSRPATPTPGPSDHAEPTPFHDSFFSLILSQLTNLVEKVRDDTRMETTGTLKTASLKNDPRQTGPRNAELIDLLVFLHTLSADPLVRMYLATPRYIKPLLALLAIRPDANLKPTIFRLLRRVLTYQTTDPYMIIELTDGTKKPLITILLDLVGAVQLWSTTNALNPAASTSTPQTEQVVSMFSRLVVGNALLHNRPFERSIKKRALPRTGAGKLALSLPFAPFFNPSLTLPFAWDPLRSPRNPLLEFSRDSRTAYISHLSSPQTSSASSSDPASISSATVTGSSIVSGTTTEEDLHNLARKAIVIRGDHSIPEGVPFFYFEVRFDINEDHQSPSPLRDAQSASSSSSALSSTAGRSGQPLPPANQSSPQKDQVSSPTLISSDANFAVGLAPSDATLWGLPGWFNGSFGYHSADGNKYRSSKEGRGERYSRRYAETDVIGCGWNRLTGTVFFTKNGTYLGTAFKNVNPPSPLVPVVGIISSQSCSVTVNFGQMPFIYDLSNMVRKSAQQVKQAHARLGVEANVLALETTALLRSLMIPTQSPWRSALLEVIKEGIANIPTLITAASHNLMPKEHAHAATKEHAKDALSSTKESSSTKEFAPGKEASRELSRESTKESTKETKPYEPAPTTSSTSSSAHQPASSTSTQVEADSGSTTDPEKQPSTESDEKSSPRTSMVSVPVASYDDLQDALLDHDDDLLRDETLEANSICQTLAILAILGGDVDDFRTGGRVQVTEGINSDLGLVLEYHRYRSYEASVLLDSQKRTVTLPDKRNFSSVYLTVKPKVHSVFEMIPLPEIVLTPEILREVMPKLVPVVSSVFLLDETNLAPAAVLLRQSLVYHRLKAESLKILINATQFGMALCELDPSLLSRLLEKNGQVLREQRLAQQASMIPFVPLSAGVTGSSATSSSASPQQTSGATPLATASTTAPPYHGQQSFGASLPLSSFKTRLEKTERLTSLLSHRVFEMNAPLELAKSCQELFMEEEDLRAPRRSVDVSNPSAPSSTQLPLGQSTDTSVVDASGTFSGPDSGPEDTREANELDSGYMADTAAASSTSTSTSSKRSSRRISQAPAPTSAATSAAAKAVAQVEAPNDLASYGKPLRFSDIKLGTHMKLCIQDKARRPGDWHEGLSRLTGEVGIVCDLDLKLQQVLMRFVDRHTGYFEDWWIPHRLLVMACTGLSYDEYWLVVSPANVSPFFSDYQVLPHDASGPAPTIASSLTSTLLAPFAGLLSPQPPAASSKTAKEEKPSKELRDSSSSKEPKEPKEGKESKDAKDNTKDAPSKENKEAKESSDTAASSSASNTKPDAVIPASATAFLLPAATVISSSREIWTNVTMVNGALPLNDSLRGSITAAMSQSPLHPRDEGTLSLALYWEHQRCNILVQMLYSGLFLNDPTSSKSLTSVSGPLQLVHALRLVSSSSGDREYSTRLLGSQSPYAHLSGALSVSSLGPRSLLSSPPRPAEYRIFETKLTQLLQSESAADGIVRASSSLSLPTSSSSSTTSTSQAATASINPASASSLVTTSANASSNPTGANANVASNNSVPSNASNVPSLELPNKNGDIAAPPTSPVRSAREAVDSTVTSSILNLPPANVTFFLSEEPLKGFLTKLGGSVFRRKKYWFVLASSTLSWYKNVQNPQPVASIDLLHLSSIHIQEKRKKDYEFDLVTPDRTLSLQATSSEEKERWISSISQQAQFAKLTNLPLTSDSLLTAFINESLLHLKDSLQAPLVIDSHALVQSANKTATTGSKKESSHKDKDSASTFVHPLFVAPGATTSSMTHSRSDSSASSALSSSTATATASEKGEKSSKEVAAATSSATTSGAAPSGYNSALSIVPAALVVPPALVGAPNPHAQAGNVIVVEQWLFPYAKRRLRKMIQLDWAENLLIVFDVACSTKAGLNVLRLYRDAKCTDFIASFSGFGPDAFPPLIIPRTDRFWMVFSSEASASDTDILSPSNAPGGSNIKAEFGIKFQVSSYITHPPASLLMRSSFEFGISIVDWLLSLSDPHWLRQGARDLFGYLTSHLLDNTQQLYDRRLKVITQMTRLLQQWYTYSDQPPTNAKLEQIVFSLFDLHATHKRLGHQDHSLLFQKTFELGYQAIRVSDVAFPATHSSVAPAKESKEPKEPRGESSSKDTKEKDRDTKKEEKEAKESGSHHKDPSASMATTAPSPASYFYDVPTLPELNFLVPNPPPHTPSPSAVVSDPLSALSSGVTSTTDAASTSSTVSASGATSSVAPAPGSAPLPSSSSEALKATSPASPRSVSFAPTISVTYRNVDDGGVTSDEDRAKLRESGELAVDQAESSSIISPAAPSTSSTLDEKNDASATPPLSARAKVHRRHSSEPDAGALDEITSGSALSDAEDGGTTAQSVSKDGASSSSASVLTSSSSKRLKKHRRVESSESSDKRDKTKEREKSEKEKAEKDKTEKDREKEREKAEKERERLEKIEKEKERLEKEKEREREKKRRKQQAKEALQRQSSKTKALPTLNTGLPLGSSALVQQGPNSTWFQHRDATAQQGHSAWLASLTPPTSQDKSSAPSSATSTTTSSSSTASATTGSAATQAHKSWLSQAVSTIKVLEKLQKRRESPSLPLPASGAAYPYNQHHDFTVEFAQEALLQACQQSVMMESPHPYPHAARVTSSVHCPKATKLLVYFDPRCCTEANCDYLMFSKETIGGDDLGFFTGASFPPSHEPLVINGDSFIWSFLSDANGLVTTRFYWGFRFTVTPVFTEEVRSELQAKCEEEFRQGATLDLHCNALTDLHLVRLVNSTVENLKISSTELNAEQALNALSADTNAAAAMYPSLLAVPHAALVRRYIYLKHLNSCIAKLVPLVDMSLHNETWSVAWQIFQSRHLLFYDVKLELLNTALLSSQTALKKPVITLNRRQAALAEEQQTDQKPPAPAARTPLSSSSRSSSTRSFLRPTDNTSGPSSTASTPRGAQSRSSSRHDLNAFAALSSMSPPLDPSAISSPTASNNGDPSSADVSSTNYAAFGGPNATQGEFLFIQGFRALHYIDPCRLRHPDKAWEVKFEGEGADDAGGPYRESVTQFCLDVHRPALDLFIPTENQKGRVGLNQDKFVPDPSATSPKQLAKFEFLGKLMGIAIRTKQPLELSLPSLVWKSLVGARLDRSDLEGIDKQLVMFLDAIENFGTDDASSSVQAELPVSVAGINAHALNALKFTTGTKTQGSDTVYQDAGVLVTAEQIMQTHLALSVTLPLLTGTSSLSTLPRNSLARDLRKQDDQSEPRMPRFEQTLSKTQFDQVFFETFRTMRTTGAVNAEPTFIDLIPNGSQVPVTWENRKQFALLVEQFRLQEFTPQIAALATGLASIIPTPVISLLSWSELELRVCGRPGLDIELLKKNTVYHQGLHPDSRLMRDFWNALASFTHEEQTLFLRFVWGRSRLPSAHEFGSQRFHILLLQPKHGARGPSFSNASHPSRPASISLDAPPFDQSLHVEQPRVRSGSISGSQSAARLMRLYYSLHGRVADDDLQALLATLDPENAETLDPIDTFDAFDTPITQAEPPDLRLSSNFDAPDDQRLPQSHTCFFQLSIPNYSRYDTLRAKLLYAITSCREIDTDFIPVSHGSTSHAPSAPSSVSSAPSAASSSQLQGHSAPLSSENDGDQSST